MNKNEIKKSSINNNTSLIESIFNRNDFSLNDLIELLEKEKKTINHGLCGSINLGNTCYLNSSIACLSNCYELTYYFLSKKFKNDINKSNKEGTKGDLAKEWYELLKEYWKSKKSKGDPSDLKKVIGKKVKIFKGYNQQDANEFMIYFLDIINEDLNRTSKKSYKEIDEQKENETDDECALRFWNYYVQRNDSIITDLFTGLFKCTVKCPNCNWVSITYETFNILQLPIPKVKYPEYHEPVKMKKVNLFYVPKYGLYETLRIQFFIKNENIEMIELIKEFQKLNMIQFQTNKLFFYLVEEQLVKDIIYGDRIYKEIKNNFIFFCEDLISENQNEKVYKIPLYFYKDDKLSSYPRFLFLNKNMKLIELLNISYLYIRKFINPPHNDYTDKINKYFQDPNDINKLIKFINKEFALFFVKDNKSEEIKNFINNKPFEFVLYNDNDQFELFSLENNSNETMELIIKYLTKKDFKIKIILIKNNPYLKKNISINSCKVSKEENNNVINNNNNNNNNYSNNENITIYDCFNQFKESENLKKNNEWHCKKCKKNILAEKQILFYYLPKLFIISLKRFKNSNGYYYKNNKYVDFPLKNLNLNELVCGFNKKNNIYDCFAICQHYGEMEGGHYTAVCKNIDEKWYNYNDDSCYPCDENNLISSQAYIIFFRRKNN